MSKRLIALFLACGLILATGCGKKTNNDTNTPSNNNDKPTVVEPSANTEEAIIGEKTIDGLKITNVTLISEGEQATFSADVVNITDAAIDAKSFNIIYKDKDGNEIVRLLGYIGSTIAPNESVTVTSSVEMNLSNAKSVEYVRNY